MFLYFVIGVAALALVLFLLRSMVVADPRTLRRLMILALVAMLVGVFFKVGQPLMATFIVVLPFLRKIFQLFQTYRFVQNTFFNKNKASRQAGSSPMTKEEAYEILGVQPGASKAEVKKAYQQQMKSNHPDKGGSQYIATKLNQAKEILLKNH